MTTSVSMISRSATAHLPGNCSLRRCHITRHNPSQHAFDAAEALATLEWYRAAGVDIAVGDDPVDRFDFPPPPLPRRQGPTPLRRLQHQRPAAAALAITRRAAAGDPGETRLALAAG